MELMECQTDVPVIRMHTRLYRDTDRHAIDSFQHIGVPVSGNLTLTA